MLGKTWQVTYGLEDVVVPCKTEQDAKLLTRQLLSKGHRVKASTLPDHSPARAIDPETIVQWLEE